MILLSTSECGQGLLEYGLAIVLVAVVIILMVSILGTAVGNLFSNVMASF